MTNKHLNPPRGRAGSSLARRGNRGLSGYQTRWWGQFFISSSSVLHQLFISNLSAIYQLFISSSSSLHQFFISSSSVFHQFIISSSSFHHQLFIISSSALHQFFVSSSTATNNVTSFAPKARRLTFCTRLSTLDYPSYIFSVSFVFLNSPLFCVISTEQWSGATSICDGIIWEAGVFQE